MAVHIIDAKGLKCPWPALLAGRMARGIKGGGLIILETDDAAAGIDIRHLCHERGLILQEETADGRVRTFSLEVPPQQSGKP
ncbi:MAG: sulfurtransferase TusA family protein [Alphaproteobacteria bacterium]|nr:sulfurtransferase TusA family protein [Alphaproteobacteria bacterium]